MRSPARKRTRGSQGTLVQDQGGPSTRNTRDLAITEPEATHEGVYEAKETGAPPGGFDDWIGPKSPLFLVDSEMEEVEGEGENTPGRGSASDEGMPLVEEELVEEELPGGETLDWSNYKGKGTYRGLESFEIHQAYESGSEGEHANGIEEGSVYDVEEISIDDEESSDLEEVLKDRAESPTY